MDGLDIAVILGSGVKTKKFYEHLLDRLYNKISTRLIYFIPTTREGNDLDKYVEYAYKYMGDKEPSDRHPIFILGDITFEEFVQTPSIRFLDDPKPENYLLFVDDFIDTRTTMISSVNDAMSLGYDGDKIFFYNDYTELIYTPQNGSCLRFSSTRFSEREFEKRLNTNILETLLQK